MIGNRKTRSGFSAALLIAGAVGALAIPSAVLALSGKFDGQPVSLSARGGIGSFTPASVDPRLARTLSIHSLAKNQMFRFTPAGSTTRPNRSVTVAVRIDPEAASLITLNQSTTATANVLGPTALRISPNAYNLGMSRGYQSFAQGIAQPRLDVRDIQMPDLASFQPSPAQRAAQPSRFTSRVTLEDGEPTGRAPRTFAGEGQQLVDVGGSYRLTRNLNVTAGVRYSQDRERMMPLTDGKQDNQAVYVGTQFHF